MQYEAIKIFKPWSDRITDFASFLAFAGELRREFLRPEFHWRCEVRI